jgi:hypothetical protein
LQEVDVFPAVQSTYNRRTRNLLAHFKEIKPQPKRALELNREVSKDKKASLCCVRVQSKEGSLVPELSWSFSRYSEDTLVPARALLTVFGF